MGCVVSTAVAANEDARIGVTAALRGGVLRTASLRADVPIGRMSSGQNVFLGDDITVGADGRLQILLLDETVFTLGANAVMRIDRFVYDPDDSDRNELAATIQSGVFRFVSGQVARLKKGGFNVKLPDATIGVRGTSVAGSIGADGTATIILLGPAPGNALGLPAGAIRVDNALGGVNVTRPGFATTLTATAPPTAPAKATLEELTKVEAPLAEQAAAEIAKALDLDAGGTDDKPDDGESAALDGEDKPEDLLKNAQGLFDDGKGDGFRFDDNKGFAPGIGEDDKDDDPGEKDGFAHLDATQISELAGLTGTATLRAVNVRIADAGSRDAGFFTTTQSWNFADRSLTAALDGKFYIDNGNGGQVHGSWEKSTRTLSWNTLPNIADVTGEARFDFTDTFSQGSGFGASATLGGTDTQPARRFVDSDCAPACDGATVYRADLAASFGLGDDQQSAADARAALGAANTLQVVHYGTLLNVETQNGVARFGRDGVRITVRAPDDSEIARIGGVAGGAVEHSGGGDDGKEDDK